jgi:hypothetical protein
MTDRKQYFALWMVGAKTASRDIVSKIRRPSFAYLCRLHFRSQTDTRAIFLTRMDVIGIHKNNNMRATDAPKPILISVNGRIELIA